MRGENRFSLNLASRVGDNRNGSENSFFLNGELHKLYKIEVKNNDGRIDRPWYFKGGIEAVDITFKPNKIGDKAMVAQMDRKWCLPEAYTYTEVLRNWCLF